jgi:uncharacterized protein YndB with AHSA1/START domain
VARVVVSTASDTEVVVNRSFAAPRALVWDCHTKPELVKQWLLGPPNWTMPLCEIDLRVGGRYRYEWRHESGERMGLSGIYREIAVPSRIVANESFDQDWTGGETLVTSAFAESHGRTTLTMTVRYSSKDARDAALKTGMTDGMEQSYTKLDAFLAAAAR